MDRKQATSTYENSDISISPDSSRELQKQRATFIEAKCKLHEKDFIYSMFYLAWLRVLFSTTPVMDCLHTEQHLQGSFFTGSWICSNKMYLNKKNC